MPASRLSEGQKAEMVGRFRQGEATVDLADAYGCSPNTVSRVVKAALDGAEYERLKRQRQRRQASPEEGTSEAGLAGDPSRDGPAGDPGTPMEQAAFDIPVSPEPDEPEAGPEEPVALPEVLPVQVQAELRTEPVRQRSDRSDAALDPGADDQPTAAGIAAQSPGVETVSRPARGDAAEQEPGVLAIEDAEDFGDEDEDEEDLGDDGDFGDEVLSAQGEFLPIPVADDIRVDGSLAGVQVWGAGAMPSSAYMLVEKTVELQPQLLRELPELGRLPDGEQERQALVLYVNPRQAKRQCGRHQRVIRIPDIQVFELTAPKLVAQGITRLVVEGSLYALPGC